MELANICTSLELSKQLKEAGYPQETFCYWVQHKTAKDKKPLLDINKFGWNDYYYTYSSPTVAELGEAIGELGGTWKLGEKWYWNYKDNPTSFGKFVITTEADARAEMWLYLKNNNLLNEKGK